MTRRQEDKKTRRQEDKKTRTQEDKKTRKVEVIRYESNALIDSSAIISKRGAISWKWRQQIEDDLNTIRGALKGQDHQKVALDMRAK